MEQGCGSGGSPDPECVGLLRRQRVFCASLADVFEDWNQPVNTSKLAPNGDRFIDPQLVFSKHGISHGLPPHDAAWRLATLQDIRDQLFALIEKTPWLDWLLLTKRPENMTNPAFVPDAWIKRWPSNVWAGTSVGNQDAADKRVPELLKVPAGVLFLSCEPLLDRVILPKCFSIPLYHCSECGKEKRKDYCNRCGTFDNTQTNEIVGVNWVIVGGESGAGARPMHPAWARSLRDQCVKEMVPFHFKQWGEFSPTFDGKTAYVNVTSGTAMEEPTPMYRVGTHNAGRLLEGREWNEYPTPLVGALASSPEQTTTPKG